MISFLKASLKNVIVALGLSQLLQVVGGGGLSEGSSSWRESSLSV
jgi:hypothetical protein